MTPEKIIEIAHRYSDKAYPAPDDSSRVTYWEFLEKDLIAFARALIEEDRKNVDDEPFLWMETNKNGDPNWDVTCMFSDSPAFIERPLPLYRRPQPKALLEDEDIRPLLHMIWNDYESTQQSTTEVVRAIEKKIWEQAE